MTTPSDKTKPLTAAQPTSTDTAEKPVSKPTPKAAPKSATASQKSTPATTSKKTASKPAAKSTPARKKEPPAKSSGSGNAGQEHIAETVKRFPSRRVWPD